MQWEADVGKYDGDKSDGEQPSAMYRFSLKDK